MKQFTNLDRNDRRRIEILLKQGFNSNKISKQLGFHRSTITREKNRNIKANGIYEANFAEKKKRFRQKQKKLGKRKLDLNPKLRTIIFNRILNGHSPDQVVERLKKLYPNDMSNRISREAIYQYIYVLGRGELKNHSFKD